MEPRVQELFRISGINDGDSLNAEWKHLNTLNIRLK
jgi:hypothetical protein